jgi:hypothetical protein
MSASMTSRACDSASFSNVTALTTDQETGILRITTATDNSIDAESFAMSKWYVASIQVIGVINCTACTREFEWSERTGSVCIICQMEQWKAQDPSVMITVDEPEDHATQPCQTVEIRS